MSDVSEPGSITGHPSSWSAEMFPSTTWVGFSIVSLGGLLQPAKRREANTPVIRGFLISYSLYSVAEPICLLAAASILVPFFNYPKTRANLFGLGEVCPTTESASSVRDSRCFGLTG